MSLTSGLSLCGAEHGGGSMSSEGCIAVGGRRLISNILSLCPSACEMVYVSILCSENLVVVNTSDRLCCNWSPVSYTRGEKRVLTTVNTSLMQHEGIMVIHVYQLALSVEKRPNFYHLLISREWILQPWPVPSYRSDVKWFTKFPKI